MLVERHKFVFPIFSNALKKVILFDYDIPVAKKISEFVESWEPKLKEAQKISEKFSSKLAENDEETKKDWLEYLNEKVELSDFSEKDLEKCTGKLSTQEYMALKNVFIA